VVETLYNPVVALPTAKDGVLDAPAEVARNVVKVPAAAAVPPIAGGLARYVEKPVPDTVDDAESVVNTPVEGVVAPIDDALIVVPLKPVAENVLASGIVTVPVKVGEAVGAPPPPPDAPPGPIGLPLPAPIWAMHCVAEKTIAIRVKRKRLILKCPSLTKIFNVHGCASAYNLELLQRHQSR
jgi:hypothetical protein